MILSPENPFTLTTPQGSFQMEIGDTCFHPEKLAVSKTVIYADTKTQKQYAWQAIAYVDDGTIHRYLFLNSQYYSYASFTHSRVSNGLFSQCSDTKHAVDWALANAESITKQMAFNDLIGLSE